MFKTIVSYFWNNQKPDLTLEDAYSVLDNANANESDVDSETEKNDIESSYDCYHKTGTITRADGNKYIIDDVYKYEELNLTVAVGTKVSFIAYNVDRKLCVSNVTILDNEWDCFEGEKKSNWCNRRLVSKVLKREGRNVLVDPGDVTIDLNAVSVEFIPLVGDWLELDVKCEVDETVTDLFGQILEINKISPLRPKIIEGVVKSWDSTCQTGVINQHIFFNREALYSGYIPSVSDKIVGEVIESEQGRCFWRALKIVPNDITKAVGNLSLFETDFENDHEDIFISGNVFIDKGKISDVINFAFTVTNESHSDLNLFNVKFENSTSQCAITNPENYPILLKAEKSLVVEGLCTIKTAGQSRDLLLFIFDHFTIGRWVDIYMKVETQTDIGYNNIKQNRSRSELYNKSRNNKNIVKGEKPFIQPRFIPLRLPEYPVPEKLWDVLSKYGDNFKDMVLTLNELTLIKPVLRKPLAFQCYEDKLHTLLHLEEISNIIAIRIYDRDQICLIKNGEFLMLEIENLSEQRPSIVCGDNIIASDPFGIGKMQLEGCVHKVGAKHVYLKFAPVFHDSYDGEDYSIRVIQSRSQIRKMHQAVGLAVRNLGREFLFPTAVQIKSLQINFTYDKYDNILNKKDEATKCQSPPRLSNTELINTLRARKNVEILAKDLESESSNAETKILLERSETDNAKKTKYKNATREVGKIKLEWFNSTLNYYQKEAVRNVLLGEARPLSYFIFGPPGTGKTVTLVETILQLLRLIPHSRLLVATPSNSAADLIALRLIDSGILKPGDLVRLVGYKYVADNKIPIRLVPYCATNNMAKDGTSSRSSIIKGNGLVLGCDSSVLGRQRIVVGTCTTVGNLYSAAFPKGHFTHIIIDEAAQATEPEVMIPLSFLDISVGQVVLAGDPMQLGPVISSKYANELGLAEPFMERMLNRFPYIRDIEGFPLTGGYDPRLVTRLVYNYRSLPEILELPNSMFYFSELLPTISPTDSIEANLLKMLGEILPTRNKAMPPAFVFHGVNGKNYQTPDSPSWFNPHEASQIFYYVNELYRLGLGSKDIGIISPYIKQVKQIRSILSEAEFDVPKIGTVEEFQGQEFNVILLSTVRSCSSMIESDKKYNLGFVSNPRRLNVALTRAQVLVIVIGNPHLLVSDTFWRNVLVYAVKNDSYCGSNLPSSLQ